MLEALRAVADAFVELPAPDAGLLVVDEPIATDAVQGGDLGAEGERALDDARAAAIREIKALASREGARFKNEGSCLASVGQIFASAVPSLASPGRRIPGSASFFNGRSRTPRTACSRTGPTSASGCGRAAQPTMRCRRFDRRPPRVTDERRALPPAREPGQAVPAPAQPGRGRQVLRAISKTRHPRQGARLGHQRHRGHLAGKVSTAEVKFTVLALAHSDAMDGTPASAPMSDRRYTLVKETRAFPKLRAALLATVRDKLARRIDIDEAVLQRLVAA